jgi:hypothetical protein
LGLGFSVLHAGDEVNTVADFCTNYEEKLAMKLARSFPLERRVDVLKFNPEFAAKDIL